MKYARASMLEVERVGAIVGAQDYAKAIAEIRGSVAAAAATS